MQPMRRAATRQLIVPDVVGTVAGNLSVAETGGRDRKEWVRLRFLKTSMAFLGQHPDTYIWWMAPFSEY